MSQPNPIRCFDGNAQPHEAFWKFINAEQSQSGQVELELDGVISEFSWFADEITPKLFKDELYRVGNGGPVLMKINSPGGDVIAASRMRAIMTDYPGEITTRIEGIAASAAVIVAIAGKQVQMTDASYMMIHDPAVVVFLAALNIEMLGKLRDDLRSIKDGIVPAYAARTGMTEDKISRMMSNETWMSAREAVDYGFADEIVQGGQKTRSQLTNLAYVNVLNSYVNVPPALITSEAEPVADNDPARAVESERLVQDERAAQSLREYVQVYK
jgi:ATP-dependent Clp protease protease subunit